MPNPTTGYKNSGGTDLGNVLITKEYLMTVYPQIANQLITPELWTWGRGDYGQLGNNLGILVSTPVTTLSGGSNWKQIFLGSITNNSAAIKTDGTLWVWGGAREYFRSFVTPQLGINLNDGIDRSTPVTTFAGGTNWKQVACGSQHMMAIKTDGTLWGWGYNPVGTLGTFDTPDKLTPVTTFAGGTNWKQVACGRYHSAAIKTDGTLWTWGFNNNGQLGNNTTNQRNTPVTTFSGGTNWKQVSCGREHTAAIKTDGTLWTWGWHGVDGQLGDNTTGVNRLTPVTTFAGGTNWKQVACGGYRHTAAIKTDGTLWTWGTNASGELGDNTRTSKRTPVTTFAGGTNWKQVSGGTNNTAAIKTDGTLWIWGNNYRGQLGTNAYRFNDPLTPVTTFAGGTNWKQISSGGYHISAIRTSDDLQGI
jgi:alpha-tubulin suppressor-like RCC1 family protein